MAALSKTSTSPDTVGSGLVEFLQSIRQVSMHRKIGISSAYITFIPRALRDQHANERQNFLVCHTADLDERHKGEAPRKCFEPFRSH